MIFKTITDDTTGTTKSISIFNSTLGTMQRNLKNGQGFVYSIFGGNQLKKSDIDGLNNYVNGIKSGLTPAQSWMENLTGCSVAAKEYVLNAKKAGKSTNDLVISLEQIPKTSKIGQVALKGFAMIGNMLLSTAITKGIELTAKAIDDYVHRLDRAKEKLEETQSDLSSVESEIATNKSKIEELESLNNLSITDKENLEQLKAQNEELRIRQQYLEQQAQQEAKDVADLTKEKYGLKYNAPTTREDIDAYKKLYENPQKQSSPTSSYLTGGSTSQTIPYAAALQNEGLMKGSDSLADLIAQYEYFEEQKKKAIQNEDLEGIEKYNKKLGETAQKLRDDRTELQEFSDDLSATGESSPELDDINGKLKLIDDTLLTKGQNLVKFIDSDALKDDKDKLVALANSGKLTADELSKNFSEVNNYLKDNDLTLEDLISIIKVYKSEIDSMSSNENPILSEDRLEELKEQAEQLSSIIGEIQSSYDTLQSAIEEYNSQGYLSLDTLQSLLDMDDSYLACLVNENGQLALNADTMNILAQAKLAEAEATAVAQAMTELYAIANGQAASSTVGYISGNASLIQSLGLLAGQYGNVATAALTAAQAQELSTAFEAANKKDSTATNKVMTGLNAKLGLIRSTASSIKTKGLGNISSIKSGSGASSASKSAAKTMEEIQKEWKEHLSKYLALYKAELDTGLIDFHTFLSKSRSMLDEFYRDGKISAKDYWDSVKDLYENQLSIYDKVLSAITRRIDREIDNIHDIIDGLEDQNDALQKQLDIYDSVLNEVDRVYDNEIEKLEDQKQAIQDVIDAMSDENDERKRAMALQQAQYNLARALSQNSNYIYKDGQFVYTTDETAIREAQDSFKDAQFDIDIAELEKQQDALDDYINVLEQYKSMWAEVADTYQTSQDVINATAILGQNYAQLILQNNLSDITNFKNQYVEIQAQINNNDELIQSYEEKIEYYESLKEQWADISKAYQQAQEDQYAAMVMGANWESDVLSGRLDVLNNFKDQYIAIQQAITNAALEAARAQAAAQTAQSASGSSGGGSSNIITSTPTKSYHVVHKLSNGFKTQSEASSKIGYYDGADGVFKDEDNKWYVYKKETYSSHMFSSISEANDYIKKQLAPWGKYGIIKYAKGTNNARKGLNLVSEDEYGDEIIVNPDGTAVIAKGEQFYPFKGGETVINASETKKLLANMNHLIPLQDDANPFSRLKLHSIDYGSMVMNSLHLFDSSALNGNIINRNNSSTIKQEITFHCPNLTDKSGIEYVERELQSLTTRAMQFDWSK